ncbi:GpE family phage tail protein [Vogesella indigofera]|nr:GpE family phage tail protein [Vogesella indigofera]
MLPNVVEDAMADVAAIFHWTPAEMGQFTLTELMQWRERARKRSGADEA